MEQHVGVTKCLTAFLQSVMQNSAVKQAFWSTIGHLQAELFSCSHGLDSFES